jgi:ElaB/YqjD/DUF883 family membrane-anchored ribosome-binding protein
MATSRRKRNTRKSSGGTRSRGFSNQLFGNAISLAGVIARNGKDLGAEKILALADATRSYSGTVASVPNVREYVTLAAESLEGLAEYVTDTEFEKMIDDAGDFARRHPWAVVGAGLAAGLLTAQLLRAGVAKPQSPGRQSAPTRKRPRKVVPRGTQQSNGRAHANA